MLIDGPAVTVHRHLALSLGQTECSLAVAAAEEHAAGAVARQRLVQDALSDPRR